MEGRCENEIRNKMTPLQTLLLASEGKRHLSPTQIEHVLRSEDGNGVLSRKLNVSHMVIYNTRRKLSWLLPYFDKSVPFAWHDVVDLVVRLRQPARRGAYYTPSDLIPTFVVLRAAGFRLSDIAHKFGVPYNCMFDAVKMWTPGVCALLGIQLARVGELRLLNKEVMQVSLDNFDPKALFGG